MFASEKQRIQKFLEDANIKLASVVSDTSGVTATQMIDELIKGDKSPKEISLLSKGKLKNKLDALEMALEGCFTDHHKFMIQTTIKRIESTAESIEELDVEINNRIIIIEASEYVDLLETIPGVGRRTAEVLIAEVGTNMNQFPNEAHLSSWSGLSPGNNQSGGKKSLQNNSRKPDVKNYTGRSRLGSLSYKKHLPEIQVRQDSSKTREKESTNCSCS